MHSRFDRRQIVDHRLYRDTGKTSDRPFMMLGALVETSLGDLICKVLFLATIKNQFDHAHLHLRYRNIRPYSREVVELVPEIDRAEGLRFFPPVWMRLWLPDSRLWRPLTRILDGRSAHNRSFFDFVVTDWMINSRNLHAMPNPTTLRLPEDRAAKLREHLVDLGLRPDKWFAVLHYRASTYGPKGGNEFRDSNPESFREVIDHIIDRLGGQAVLLGHPELPAFPARSGFVDLSRIRDSFLLQAAAVSHSRFMIAGPSGPVALGWGFQVPICLVDATDAHGGWGEAEQTLLTHTVRTPAGNLLKNRELFEGGLLEKRILAKKIKDGQRYTIFKNTGTELAAVADYLLERTPGVTGWRERATVVPGPRPNQFVWPPRARENLRFFGEGLPDAG